MFTKSKFILSKNIVGAVLLGKFLKLHLVILGQFRGLSHELVSQNPLPKKSRWVQWQAGSCYAGAI